MTTPSTNPLNNPEKLNPANRFSKFLNPSLPAIQPIPLFNRSKGIMMIPLTAPLINPKKPLVTLLSRPSPSSLDLVKSLNIPFIPANKPVIIVIGSAITRPIVENTLNTTLNVLPRPCITEPALLTPPLILLNTLPTLPKNPEVLEIPLRKIPSDLRTTLIRLFISLTMGDSKLPTRPKKPTNPFTGLSILPIAPRTIWVLPLRPFVKARRIFFIVLISGWNNNLTCLTMLLLILVRNLPKPLCFKETLNFFNAKDNGRVNALTKPLTKPNAAPAMPASIPPIPREIPPSFSLALEV